MVIFGTSGDLTRRLLMPAIYNLSKAGRLSDNFALIGVDRSKRTVHAFRDDLADGIRKFVSDTGGVEAGAAMRSTRRPGISSPSACTSSMAT
jgi:glucose-6-phosphate 1-dehydrogenase